MIITGAIGGIIADDDVIDVEIQMMKMLEIVCNGYRVSHLLLVEE